MRWAGFMARVEKREMHNEFWCSNLKEIVHWEHQSTDRTVVLKWMSVKWV